MPTVDWNLANNIAKLKDLPYDIPRKPHPWDNWPMANKALLRAAESQVLYICAKELAVRYGGGSYADLGVFRGGSTVAMGYGIRDAGAKGRIYSVDLFGDVELENKFGCRSRNSDVPDKLKEWFKKEKMNVELVICKGTTEDWGKKINDKLNMVFIDADHKYENVKKDFELWSPKVRKDGFVVFHDCNVVDVDRVIKEMPNWYELVHFYYTTKVFRKLQ